MPENVDAVNKECCKCVYWKAVVSPTNGKWNPVGFKRAKTENTTHAVVGLCKSFSNPMVAATDLPGDFFEDDPGKDEYLSTLCKTWWKKNKTPILTAFFTDADTILPSWIVRPTSAYGVITKHDFYCSLFKSHKDANIEKGKNTSGEV